MPSKKTCSKAFKEIKKIKLFSCFLSEGRSCHPELSEGGAFQVSLAQLQVDCYPYHLATGDRSSWIRYNTDSSVHTQWLENSLKQFQSDLLESVALKVSFHYLRFWRPHQLEITSQTFSKIDLLNENL